MQRVAPYDLLEDLGKLKVDITIKQLLGIALSCRTLLQSTLVRKRLKPIVNEVTISSDPGAPIVTDVLGQDFQYFKKNLIRTTEESREKNLTQVY